MKGPLLAVFITVIILLAIWDGVWKVIALWKSARHDQLAWFICLAIFNTAGILPILLYTVLPEKWNGAAANPSFGRNVIKKLTKRHRFDKNRHAGPKT